MRKHIIKAMAGLLAFGLATGALPAVTGTTALFGDTAVSVSAEKKNLYVETDSVSKGDVFRPGDQIYAYLNIRVNYDEGNIELSIFAVNGENYESYSEAVYTFDKPCVIIDRGLYGYEYCEGYDEDGNSIYSSAPYHAFTTEELTFIEAKEATDYEVGYNFDCYYSKTLDRYYIDNGEKIVETDKKSVIIPALNQEKTDISGATVNMKKNTADVTSVVLNGETLSSETDYDVSYKDITTGDVISKPTTAGEYKVVISGNGDYEGTVEKNFTVVTYSRYGANSPTYDSNGNIEYYIGSDNVYYADTDGTILPDKNGDGLHDQDDTVIAKLSAFMQLNPDSASGGNVDINIYAPLPDGESTDDYKIRFGNTEKTFSQCDTTTVNGQTYYKLRIETPAKNMRDEYGYAILKGTVTIKSGNTSVYDYAETITTGVYPDRTKKICRAMLSYGTEAQKFFKYEDENLAAMTLKDGEGTYHVDSVTVPTANFYKSAFDTALENAPVSYAGMSLTLEYETYLTIGFKVTSGTQDEAIDFIKTNFTLDDAAIPDSAIEKNGTQYITVDTRRLAIKDLMSDIKLTYNGNDYTFNAGQYMWTASNSKTAGLADTVKALYNYYTVVTTV